jgi:hypothetical protein
MFHNSYFILSHPSIVRSTSKCKLSRLMALLKKMWEIQKVTGVTIMIVKYKNVIINLDMDPSLKERIFP